MSDDQFIAWAKWRTLRYPHGNAVSLKLSKYKGDDLDRIKGRMEREMGVFFIDYSTNWAHLAKIGNPI